MLFEASGAIFWSLSIICLKVHNLQLQSNLDYPDLDYPDFFSGPNLVMNIY